MNAIAEEKNDCLRSYLFEVEKNGIVQRSEKWKSERQLTIGGSEISSVIGKNYFRPLKDLLLSKLKLVPESEEVEIRYHPSTKLASHPPSVCFDADSSELLSYYFHKEEERAVDGTVTIRVRIPVRNIDCMWGTLFEHIIRHVACVLHDTTVVGSESFITAGELSYSPDGLGVVKFQGDYSIALFEFKCPYRRLPSASIPGYYIPQVYLGLKMIPITSVGIFLEGIFRRCKFRELGYNDCCNELAGQRSFKALPCAYGVIGFTISSDDPRARELVDLLKRGEKVGDSIVDLGACSHHLLERVFHSWQDGLIDPWYSPVVMTRSSDPKAGISAQLSQAFVAFARDCKKKGNLVGILPWKLLKVSTHYVQPDRAYFDKYSDGIKRTVAFLRSVAGLSLEEKKREVEIFTGGGEYDDDYSIIDETFS